MEYEMTKKENEEMKREVSKMKSSIELIEKEKKENNVVVRGIELDTNNSNAMREEMKSPALNNSVVESILSRYEHNTIIFTDGSKSESGTGLAFVIPSINIAHRIRITDTCSVFTANAVAIEKSLTWCKQNPISGAALTASPFKQFQNRVIFDIKRLLLQLSLLKKEITFLWTKAHVGVVGNERADLEAKKASISNIIMEYLPSQGDIVCSFKKAVRTEWQIAYADMSHKSNNHYFSIHPTLPNNIPHIPYKSKYFSSTISRLKLNHGRFPSHLYKLGIIESPFCTCNTDKVADLNHLFFDCSNHSNACKELLEELIRNNIHLPTNITCLLAANKEHIFDSLIKFLSQHIIGNHCIFK
nr:unnamed protein product [Callosobruchus chinensis]